MQSLGECIQSIVCSDYGDTIWKCGLGFISGYDGNFEASFGESGSDGGAKVARGLAVLVNTLFAPWMDVLHQIWQRC